MFKKSIFHVFQKLWQVWIFIAPKIGNLCKLKLEIRYLFSFDKLNSVCFALCARLPGLQDNIFSIVNYFVQSIKTYCIKKL